MTVGGREAPKAARSLQLNRDAACRSPVAGVCYATIINLDMRSHLLLLALVGAFSLLADRARRIKVNTAGPSHARVTWQRAGPASVRPAPRKPSGLDPERRPA